MILVLCILLFFASPVFATTRYVDTTLASDCTSGNYDLSTRTCAGNDGDAYNTIAKGVTPTVAGDTLYLRGGTYPTNQRIDLQLENKTGTAGNYITIAGFPGDSKPTLQYSDPASNSYGMIKARGNRGYFIFEDLILDGINLGVDTTFSIRDLNHHFILRRIEIKNQHGSGIYFDNVNDIVVEDSYVHDARTTCIVGQRYHGFYVHHGTNITLRRNKVLHMPGIGVQVFPGPWDGVTVKDNWLEGNNHCVTTNNGGLVLYASSGNINNMEVSGNVVIHNGFPYNGFPGGAGGGLRILRGGAYNFTNTTVHNNTITDNTYNPNACTNTPCPDHEQGNAVNILSGVTGVELKNNILTGNNNASVVDYSSLTKTHNACTAGESCGSTGKVTVTAVTDCIISTSDVRLKQGTNPCRNAGTSVTTRPSPVGVPDIGAFEQGLLSSASALGTGGIEVLASVMTPGLLPSSGITGFTATCVGCTGTPVVSSATLKAGANTTILLTLTGISVAGSCTITLGSTNLTDAGAIGTSSAAYQGLNTVSGMSVTGNCSNTGGSGGSVTYSKFLLADGSGTVAADSSGLSHAGTVSTGVTWVNDSSGTGVTIPADAVTYRYVSSTYGNTVNPTTQDFAACATVLPDLQYDQKVVISSTTNGTNQRWYAGWFNVAGQKQWGVGAQSSGFTTGSEFPVLAQKTLICLVNDSTADTVTLWVNGVKGAISGKSVKTVTSYTLAGNIAAGADGINTVNTGGQTIYELYVWNTKPSDGELQALYTELFPAGGSSSGYAQVTHQAQRVYLDGSSNPVNYGSAAGIVDVMDGGAVYIKFQIDCTGGACASTSFVPRYSKDGTTFNLTIPNTIGVDGIAMYGSSADATLNRFAALCCITGALTPNNGVTVLTASATQPVALSINNSYTTGIIVRFGTGLAGQSFWIKLYQENGQALTGTYNPSSGVQIRITASASSGAP